MDQSISGLRGVRSVFIITVLRNFILDLDDAESDDEQVIPLRGYQKELAKEGCEGENVIILAPTNSGKTWVACKIIQVVSSSVATAKAEQKNVCV